MSLERFVFVLPQGHDDSCEWDFLSLRHPSKDIDAKYLVSQGNCYEIQVVKEEHRSWFIGESVKSDGALYIASIIDPMFLVLSRLEELGQGKRGDSGVFVDVDSILTSSEEPNMYKLKSCNNLDFSLVCDVKTIPSGGKFYRLSKDRLRAWIECKMDNLCKLFEGSTEPLLLSRGRSSTFTAAKKSQECDRATLVRYCAGILSEYLPKTAYAIVEDLYKDELSVKPLADFAYQPSASHGSSYEDEFDADTEKGKKTEKKAPVISLSQRKLAKVDKRGMKSINSFFSKAPASESASSSQEQSGSQ
eukprot:TRINITY_DN9122_c0_g1_i2.p1 TRINITY_DN9122_c0_g1~~TRINITY_DN9122_c0_g1_i2.p1  ORF type:complete len:304 (-),score=72.53 TRINITY_DN9122_c0_g1_i2:78-989(-)